MLKRYLAMALALSIVALLPAGAAATGISFTPLKRSITASHLGKHKVAGLRRGVHRARVAYRGHRYCASLRALGGVVERAAELRGGVRVERAARKLQRRIFIKHAARRGRCGLARPRFRVAASVKPTVKRLPSLSDGHPRVVARLAGKHGVTTDFVQDELVVEGDRAAAAKLAERWHGKVLDSASARKPGGRTSLIRIDARHAPTGDLAADLIKVDPRSRGAFKVSSRAGLGLLAVAADAAAHGLKVAPDVLTEDAGVLDRSTTEATLPAGTVIDKWDSDAYGWWYTGSLGTGDAWRALAIGGRTSNRVKLAVLDDGFSTAGLPDLSPASTGADNVKNPGKCTGGKDCPWHGTNVASTAAGVVDNGLGAAGSGGQVADVAMIHNGHTMFSSIDAIYEALDAGAKVINISSGYELDATVSIFNIPYEDATQTAFERGALVVASAGNDGRDVDAEDCFIVCWEEEWIAPCENDPVICVGGIDEDGRRDAMSNYGREWCGNAQDCDVDIFAPMTVWVGPDGADPNPHLRGGTSFSSPYVAGVLATIMAADPNISLADAKQALLDTADHSADETVSRVVNAGSAVTDVTDNKLGPLVKISQADAKPLYGGFHTTTLKAKLYSVGPCKCTITWSSDKDGPMGTGQSIGYVYESAGPRTVTATVKDAGTGATATDKVKVEATNEAPRVDITKPGDYAHVYSGQPFTLKATASDSNQLGGLPCTSFTWDAPDNHGVTGCSPTMTLWGEGVITYVQVKVTDADGASGWANIHLIIDKPPAHSPPLVTILSPSEGDLLEPSELVALKGTATDPDAGPLTGTWSVKYGATTKVIGTGNTLQWKPSDYVPQGCGNKDATLIFSATDPDGTTSDQVGIKIHYPVC